MRGNELTKAVKSDRGVRYKRRKYVEDVATAELVFQENIQTNAINRQSHHRCGIVLHNHKHPSLCSDILFAFFPGHFCNVARSSC